MNIRTLWFVLFFFVPSAGASGLSKPVWVGPKAIGMGGAFVGVADDTTAIFHNPAGMTQLPSDHTIEGGADILITDLDYTPPGGVTEKAETEFLPVPQFGYVNRQMKILSFGIGLFFPHGNGGTFEASSAIPTNPLEGRIYSTEIVPAVAFDIFPELSIGASLRLTRISISLYEQSLTLPAPTNTDTLEALTASGWGYGASVGFLAKPTTWLRFGANYRSRVDKVLEGRGIFTTLGNFDADFDVTLPSLVTVGFSGQVNKALLLSFQYGWERNSEIENFVVTSTELGSTFTLPQAWQDSHTFHFGAQYEVCDAVSILAGYARDFTTSIPDTAMNRITGDIDAHEVSTGALFRFGKRYNAGISWNGRLGDRDIPNSTENPAPGHYEAFVHAISANLGVRL